MRESGHEGIEQSGVGIEVDVEFDQRVEMFDKSDRGGGSSGIISEEDRVGDGICGVLRSTHVGDELHDEFWRGRGRGSRRGGREVEVEESRQDFVVIVGIGENRRVECAHLVVSLKCFVVV